MDREIERAVAIGEANKRVLELAQNWCAHLSVELRGGVGIIEQMTGAHCRGLDRQSLKFTILVYINVQR